MLLVCSIYKKRHFSESLTEAEDEDSRFGLGLSFILTPLKYKGRSLQPHWWFSSFCDLEIPKTFPAEAWISSRKHIPNMWPVAICREEAENHSALRWRKTGAASSPKYTFRVITFKYWGQVYCYSQAQSSFCQSTSSSLVHTSESSLHLLSHQTWLDHPSSGLQGAHLAPLLALLLTFHVVPAKSHHLNIHLCRSTDMISPFAHISHSCYQHL